MATLSNPDFPDQIIAGDKDTRNVIDHYKYWARDKICQDLREHATPLHVIAENFAHDFNIATLVRNANAFNANSVTMVGRRKWDRRGAVGTHHYTPIYWEKDPEEYYKKIKETENSALIVVDNIPGSYPLPDFEWPMGNVHVVFGQESIGISNVALEYADDCIAIPQLGSVRSLNVGACSSIIMYDYTLRTGRLPE